MALIDRHSTIVFLLWFPSVFCDEKCITYDFEDSFHEQFTPQTGLCGNMVPWLLGSYSDSTLDSPHARSTSFVSPQTLSSCVQSFQFTMENRGVLDVDVYTKSETVADQLTVLVQKVRTDGSGDTNIGFLMFVPSISNITEGWHRLTVPLTSSATGSFNGYVSI